MNNGNVTGRPPHTAPPSTTLPDHCCPHRPNTHRNIPQARGALPATRGDPLAVGALGHWVDAAGAALGNRAAEALCEITGQELPSDGQMWADFLYTSGKEALARNLASATSCSS
jgi:hypothetical protein